MSKDIIHIQEQDYNEILRQTVAIIENTRLQIASKVNESVSSAYWEIGKILNEHKTESGHGDGVVKRLSADLKYRFPKIGMSPRQLWNMKKFYIRYANSELKLLQRVAVLPWSHNLYLLSKGLDDEATVFYANETIAKGWNRDLLPNAIKMKIHETHALTLVDNNFAKSLPAEQAAYANEVFK